MNQKVYEFTREMITQVESQGMLTCPECKGLMTYIDTKKLNKSEFYCEKCHVSIPIYK